MSRQRATTQTTQVKETAEGAFAAIHIGVNAISLLLGEYHAHTRKIVRKLDSLKQPLPLAREVFEHRALGSASIERAVEILIGYREVMREYGIDRPPDRLVAANVLLEAHNCDTLLNRIEVALGWKTNPLEDGEMTRLIHIEAQRLFSQRRRLGERKALVCHIGPGNTRTLFFDEGGRLDYHNYQLGIERTRVQVELNRGPLSVTTNMIVHHAQGVADQMAKVLKNKNIRHLIAIGQEIQQIAPLIGASSSHDVVVPVKRLAALAAEMESEKAQRSPKLSALDYRTRDTLLYTLGLHLAVAQNFGAKEMYVPPLDFEETLLTELVSAGMAPENFRPEVVQTALNLGGRFQIDLFHAQCVAHLSEQLFVGLSELHGLGQREALILQVAAILHETGRLIAPKDFNVHSEYVIRHNEVFGLGHQDIREAALVARYHCGEPPSAEYGEYQKLDRDRRLSVSKMAALLRVAVALDQSRIQDVVLEKTIIEPGILRLQLKQVHSLATVSLAMNEGADLFTSVFGLDVVIEITGRTTNDQGL